MIESFKLVYRFQDFFTLPQLSVLQSANISSQDRNEKIPANSKIYTKKDFRLLFSPPTKKHEKAKRYRTNQIQKSRQVSLKPNTMKIVIVF